MEVDAPLPDCQTLLASAALQNCECRKQPTPAAPAGPASSPIHSLKSLHPVLCYDRAESQTAEMSNDAAHTGPQGDGVGDATPYAGLNVLIQDFKCTWNGCSRRFIGAIGGPQGGSSVHVSLQD